MKVIFVDDEPMVLNGIKRALFKTDWDIVYATSGAQALEILQEFSADYIVSDMRMPGMNGAELLEKVSELYPSIVRIILSGHADLDLSARATYVAHQWYNKPCDPQTLKIELERINEVRCGMPYGEIQKLVGQVQSLPSIPKTFIKIKSILRDTAVTMKDVSSLISEDPSLTAKVLQVANSSFFVTSAKVSSIDDAIIRLGVDVICNIVVVAEIYANFDGASSDYFEEILQRSLNTAKLASSIVEKPLRDTTMLVGILHNIGELILDQINPEAMDTYLAKRIIGADNETLEQSLFQVDSIQIASYLLHLWHFPYSIIECVILQNKPKKLISAEFGCAAAIYIAKRISNQLEVDQDVISHFDISNQLETWCDKVEQEL